MPALTYDNAEVYDCPNYMYDGAAVGRIVLAVRGLVRDLTPLAGIIDDLSGRAGLLADRAPAPGEVADRTPAAGVFSDGAGIVGGV